ncbi:tetratricopeptide repeat-containing sulfotransferase family protein [Microbulbifer agarilyticus]
MTATASGDLATAIRQAYQLLNSGQRQLAKEQAEEIQRIFPDEVNAGLVLAICARLEGDIAGATQLLTHIIQRAPDFASALHEFGLCNARLGRHASAVEYFERAVSQQPQLTESWQALAEYYTAQEDEERAAHARAQHLRHSSTESGLIQAVSFLEQGKIAQAEDACRTHLKNAPKDVNAIRMLAEIGAKVGALDDVENLLERCLELAPDFHFARLQYAGVLNRREKSQQSLSQIEFLENIPRPIPAVQVLKAAVLAKLGRFELAIDAYTELLKAQPEQPSLLVSRGHAEKTLGRHDEAVRSYRAAIAFNPDFGEAWWSLANLKTFRFSDEERAHMATLLDHGALKTEDRVHVLFALAKAEEDAGAYAQSFSHYDEGNTLKARQEGYQAEATSAQTDALIETCSQHWFESLPQGHNAADPIFIVGLPRSGSTLLEQILASHSMVDGTKELPDILSMVRRLSGQKKRSDLSRYPAVLTELDGEALRTLGKEYLARTQIQRGEAPFFIDKMPNNFAHVGFIKAILPNARIIDARRHPMACCFSGFKQLFAAGQTFTYGLENIGRYYLDYLRLMDHWQTCLPDQVLTVQYEEVVSDLEAQVRRILAFCELPFEQACLDFHRTDRSVRTASSEQVRQPINRAGLEAWQPFSPYLDRLTETLKSALPRFDRYKG